MKVKICGVKTIDDARTAADAGADMLGLNFYKSSPRYIEPEDARTLAVSLREQLGEGCPLLVGIFVNEVVSNVSRTMDRVGLDAAQLSGDESDAMLIELRGVAYKGIRPPNKVLALDDAQYYLPHAPKDDRFPSLLLDAHHPKLYGGTGEEASVEVAQAVNEVVPRLMLAGGLTPENVAERVRQVKPWGVDVASGVESEPGVKDAAKVRAFIEAAKA